MKEKRNCWKKLLSEYDVNNLVFLDESGVNTDMTRPYARALGGQRTVDSTPVNTPSSTTVLSSVKIDGETAYTTYQGGTTAEKFAEYLRTKLFPTLEPDSIIIMDNMRSHHAKNIKLILEQSGLRYLYLPPYSPDLNPIEKLWSKIKAFLRKEKVRNAEELPCAIKSAFATISKTDCQGWFRACGYMR
ncbi:MAG: IS630 family transposase [Epulopiscium sp.]|nr:IS630 family transposase [Candidatus Epulonipiscium sp.]